MSRGERPKASVPQKFAQTDIEFINTAYKIVLNRAPDPTGLNHYLARLKVGISRAEVFDQLRRSHEAKARGFKLRGSSWLSRKAGFFGRMVAGFGLRHGQPASPELLPHAVEPPKASRKFVQLDEPQLMRDILEGLVHAVQGLQQATCRSEQTFALLRAELSDRLNTELDRIRSELVARREQDTVPDPVLATLDQKTHWLSVDNDNIRKRIEFIRKEIMFELRRAISQSALAGAAPSPSPTHGKFGPHHQPRQPPEFAADAPRRVNLGCGHLALDGFMNLDVRDLPGVNIVADLRRLPFTPGSIDELRATHVIEHFTEHALLTEVLPHWASVLRPNGTLTVTAPNARAIMEGLTEGAIEWEAAKTVLMGGQEYEGDFHFALLDPATVCTMLKATGFATTRITTEARPNGDCLEFEIIATR